TKLVILDLINGDWTGSVNSPVAFMSIDVDYYSSTIAVLNNLGKLRSELLLPNTVFYFDDIQLPNHNPFQGELLAIEEFNQSNKFRKIVDFSKVLRTTRRLKNALWINHIFQLHVLDHTIRNEEYRNADDPPHVLANKYLK
ncbi:MAG TPA: hypothetical protein VGO58_14090, partial [Chitinophagaceae bacterium]|nr:hypothetical protein [Chitinophagaceae bacterium]